VSDPIDLIQIALTISELERCNRHVTFERRGL
jgi:hypothetical protein